MKKVIVSVFDKKASVFGQPFFVRSAAEATRLFQDEVNRVADDNMLNKHPADFSLYLVGWFDDEFGAVSAPERADLIVDANSLVNGV